MNNNESRSWLMWLIIILVAVAVVYFVRNRMMKKEEASVAEIAVVTDEMEPETQVDAVQNEAAPSEVAL